MENIKKTKKEIKKEVDRLYEHCVYHKGLPKAYKYGLTHFKSTIVNHIHTELMHLHNRINRQRQHNIINKQN